MEYFLKDMSLTDHLEELRNRLIRIAIILIISFCICYGFGAELQEILLIPLRSALGVEGKVIFLGILDKVLTQFQLAFWSSIIISSPFWFRELWLFIRPGLYDKEAKNRKIGGLQSSVFKNDQGMSQFKRKVTKGR